MLKKYLVLALTALLLNLSFCVSGFAQTSSDRDSRLILNVKNTVARVGTEPNRKIKIQLKNGTKLKGYITEIKDDYFALLDTKTGKVTSVQYAEVMEAKRDGLSKLARSLIVMGVTLGALVGLTAIAAAAGELD